MAVFKRRTRWVVRFKLRGRTYWRSVPEARTRRDALTAENRFKGELSKGNYEIVDDASRITFKELARRYGEYSLHNKRSHKSDRAPLARLVAEFGTTPISDIKPFRIEQFKKKMLSSTKSNGSAYRPATINRTLEVLGKMFSMALANGWIASHPMRGKVRRLKQDNTVERVLSDDEERRLLRACLGLTDDDEAEDLTQIWIDQGSEAQHGYLYPLLVALLSTGARRGEILSLTWENVDLEQRRVWFRRTKTGRDRAVYVTDDLLRVLRALPKVAPSVFTNPDTNRPYVDIKNSFRAVCKQVGIVGLRLHDLQHTVGTRLGAHVPIQDIMRVLGHTQHSSAMRYVHPVDDRIKEALENIRPSTGGVQRGVQTPEPAFSLSVVNY